MLYKNKTKWHASLPHLKKGWELRINLAFSLRVFPGIFSIFPLGNKIGKHKGRAFSKGIN